MWALSYSKAKNHCSAGNFVFSSWLVRVMICWSSHEASALKGLSGSGDVTTRLGCPPGNMTEILCSHEVSWEPSRCSWDTWQPLLGGNTECEHPYGEKDGAQGGCSSDALTPVYTEEALRHMSPRLWCLPQAPQTFPPEPSLGTDCPLGTSASPATLRVEPLESLRLGPLCCAGSSEWLLTEVCAVAPVSTLVIVVKHQENFGWICVSIVNMSRNIHWNLPFVFVCVRSLVYGWFWGAV